MGRRAGSRNLPLDRASVESLQARARRIERQAALVTARLGYFESAHPSDHRAIEILKRELARVTERASAVRAELQRRENP